MSSPKRKRNGILWIALIAVVIALGLASRRFHSRLPTFVAEYAGDTLWATVAFLGFGLIQPAASTLRVAIQAMLFAIAIEVSQLYHAPWIDSIRRTTVGALILGHGFLRSDLVCYAAGVGLGILIERIALMRRSAMRT